MYIAKKIIIVCSVGILCSISFLFAYKSPSIYHEKIAKASEDIVHLMKTDEERYTYENVLDALYILQQKHGGIPGLILEDLKVSIQTFSTCRTHGGEWISFHRECQYISRETCESVFDGQFNSCASACRHMDTGICTLECIPLCTL